MRNWLRGRLGAIGFSASRIALASGAAGSDGTDDEIVGGTIVALAHRNVHLVARSGVEGQVPHVRDNADDASLAGASVEHELADRVLPRPKRLGHGLVDNDHGFARRRVTRCDVAAGDEPDSHRGRVAVGRHAHEGDRRAAALVGHALARAPQVRLRPSGSASVIPAASTPGTALTSRSTSSM